MPELRNPSNPSGRHVGRLEPVATLPVNWRPYVYRGTNQPDKCGTEPGYQQHRAANEHPCDQCAQAHKHTKATEAAKKRRQRARAKETK